MSCAAFIALEPDSYLRNQINLAKQAVRQRFGMQRYVDDLPHLTLIVNCFPDLDEVKQQVREVAQDMVAPTIHLLGWHAFLADPLTGGNTVVATIDEPAKRILRALQARLLERIAPYRDLAQSVQRYAPFLQFMNAVRRTSVASHGFPFTGTDWEPHLSIASINTDSWSECWDMLAQSAPVGRARLTSIGLYRLDHENRASQILSQSLDES